MQIEAMCTAGRRRLLAAGLTLVAIRELAAEVGREHGLEEDWINDGVKGFVSSCGSLTTLELNLPNLSVLMPVPEYLLAMKCVSARTGESARDLEDVKFLIQHLQLDRGDQVLSLVEAYYPASRITMKNQYFVEAAFEELATDRQRAANSILSSPEITPEENARYPF